MTERVPETSTAPVEINGLLHSTVYRDAYPRYTKLFFHALGYLARQGFAAQPADAMDVIQDFFIEGWPTVLQHFDPQQGRFEAYLYAAFVRFARRRIVQMRRWSDDLVDNHELASRVESPISPQPVISSKDRKNVELALESLAEDEKQMLGEYLTGGPRSERAIARRLGLSRFSVHATLLRAMAHVAVRMQRPERVEEDDWQVAIGLWRNGNSPIEVAKELCRTTTSVRAARDRVTLFLADIQDLHRGKSGSPVRNESKSEHHENR